jgi:hypothetical protein
LSEKSSALHSKMHGELPLLRCPNFVQAFALSADVTLIRQSHIPMAQPHTTSASAFAASQPNRVGCPKGIKLFSVLWLVVAFLVCAKVAVYSHTPGPSAAAPVTWPTRSGISPDHRQPTLLMFLHPQCPCSKASLAELERLALGCQNRVDIHVVVITPDTETENWLDTDQVKNAKSIPGVTVDLDKADVEAKRFGVQTSGDALLYDQAGHLLYHGGITGSRGHQGDNAGFDAVFSLIQTSSVAKAGMPLKFPAFGCQIFDPKPNFTVSTCTNQ